MTVKISGVLKDGTGKPIQNCTIQLKARRNSTRVVVNTVASENPDEAGRYSMDVECGQYNVILLVEGFPPSHAGIITVYEDSQPGTLNDFLCSINEIDLRPENLRRFEKIASEINRLAEQVREDGTRIHQSEQNTEAWSDSARKSADISAAGAKTAVENERNARHYAEMAEQNAEQVARSVINVESAREDAEHFAEIAKKSAESMLQGSASGPQILQSPENLLRKQNDALFVDGTHHLIPKVSIKYLSTNLDSLRSLPDGSNIYSVTVSMDNPLKRSSVGGIQIFSSAHIDPSNLYLDREHRYIPAQYFVKSISVKPNTVMINISIVMQGTPWYALNLETLKEEGNGDSGVLPCKLLIRLITGTTLFQNGIG